MWGLGWADGVAALVSQLDSALSVHADFPFTYTRSPRGRRTSHATNIGRDVNARARHHVHEQGLSRTPKGGPATQRSL